MKRLTRILAWIPWLLLTACQHVPEDPIDLERELEGIRARTTSKHGPEPRSLASFDHTWFPLARDVDTTDGLDIAEANTLALLYAPDLVLARKQRGMRRAELVRSGLIENPEFFLGPRVGIGEGELILPASLAFEWSLGGARSIREERAAHELRAAHIRAIEQELEALLRVRSAFIELAAIEARLEVTKALVTHAQDAHDETERLAQARERNPSMRFTATLRLDDAQRELEQLETRRSKVHLELSAACGLLPDASRVFVAEDTFLEPVRADVLTDVPRTHPRLLALLAEHQVAEANLQLELANQYPTLQIGPEFESDDGDVSVGLGAAFRIPIFHDNRASIDASLARRSEARTRWQNALLQIARDQSLLREELALAKRNRERLEDRTLVAALRAQASVEAMLTQGLIDRFAAFETITEITHAKLATIDARERLAQLSFQSLLYTERALSALLERCALLERVETPGEKP